MRLLLVIGLVLLLPFNCYADSKVSALTDITNPVIGDDMYIIDDPDVTPLSRKISVGVLLGVSPALDDDGTITDDYIDSADYAAGSIDNEHLAVNSVDSDNYVDASIDEEHLADNSLDSDSYVNGSIDAEHLAADIIDETKIADNGIDSEHYNDDSIDADHIDTINCGTNCTWDATSDEVDVDDAFLVNDANDSTSGTLTSTGFIIGSADIDETELEIIDGGTLGTGDLNIIDGISDSGSLTAAELLFVDGVTSAIQTQIDSKQSTLSNEAGLYAALSDVSIFVQAENDSLYSVVARQGVAGASIYASDIVVTSGAASASVVDTQYLEYSTGGAVTVRDSLDEAGTASAVVVDTQYIDNSLGDVTVRDNLTVNGSVSSTNVKGSKTIQFTIAEPDQLDASALLPVWSNESGSTFNISSIKGWANTSYNVILSKIDSDGANDATVADFSVDTLGTSIYEGSTSSASAPTVTNTQLLYFDATSEVPDYIKVTVIGTYD